MGHPHLSVVPAEVESMIPADDYSRAPANERPFERHEPFDLLVTSELSLVWQLASVHGVPPGLLLLVISEAHLVWTRLANHSALTRDTLLAQLDGAAQVRRAQ